MADSPGSQPFPHVLIVAGIIIVIVIAALVFSGIFLGHGKPVTTPAMSGITGNVPGTGSSPAVPSLTLNASPKRYSPLMSSTIGIGIEPVAHGFDPTDAVFVWNTTFGQFLGWNQSTYQVSESGSQCRNNGTKLYWSYYDLPGNSPEPVIITVTAQDPETGTVIARSSLTLGWVGWDQSKNITGYAMAVVEE